jgi:hypothetical protein
MTIWLLLSYKLPSEPSARRVYIWRKLKRLGAITLFDAVWALPDTPRTHEQFQWLAAEIQEMGGEAMFWKAQAELAEQEETLISQFQIQVEEIYRALLERMDHNQMEAAKAAQEYQQIRQRDYFQSQIGLQIRERLLAARESPL